MYLKLIPLSLAIFAVGTTTSIPVGIIPVVATDLDVTPAAAGQMTSAFALAFAISAPVMSAILGSLSRRAALVIALTIFVIGNVGVALSHDYTMVLVFRAITGIGAGAINANALSAGAEIAGPEKRGSALGFIMSFLALATALGVPIGTWVGGIDWHLAFWGVAVIGAIAAIGSWTSVRLPKAPAMRIRTRFAPLANPWVLRVVLVTLCMVAGSQVYYNYLGVAAGPVTNHDQGLLALILLIAGPFSIIGMQIAGRLTDRVPIFGMLVVALSIQMVVMLLAPFMVLTLPLLITWLCIYGLFGGGGVLPQQQRMLGWSTTLAPVLIGLNSAAIYGGLAVGAILGGVLQTWIPVDQLGFPAAAVIGLGILVALTTRRPPISPEDKLAAAEALNEAAAATGSGSAAGAEPAAQDSSSARPAPEPGRVG